MIVRHNKTFTKNQNHTYMTFTIEQSEVSIKAMNCYMETLRSKDSTPDTISEISKLQLMIIKHKTNINNQKLPS